MTTTARVRDHYTLESLEERILDALRATGADLEALRVDDLAPVDAFHVRGRMATEELVGRAAIRAEDEVLDVGSGLGGTARFLIETIGCRVTGVDLTPEYCRLATLFSERVGQAGRAEFRAASALDLPFPDHSYDVVWTEHVQMNVADKRRFYEEIHRVLRPGGRLAFHDILAGSGEELHYPVPWADEAAISHLIAADRLPMLLEEVGFAAVEWEDVSGVSRQFFDGLVERLRAGEFLPLGIHLLMGPTAKDKLLNMRRNLEEDRVRVVQAVLRRPA